MIDQEDRQAVAPMVRFGRRPCAGSVVPVAFVDLHARMRLGDAVSLSKHAEAVTGDLTAQAGEGIEPRARPLSRSRHG